MKQLAVVVAIMLAAAAAYAGGADPGSGLNRGLDTDRPGDTNFDRPGGADPLGDRSMQLPTDRSLRPNRAGDAPEVPDVDETDPTTAGDELKHKPTSDLPPDVNDGALDNPAGPGTMR